jgi:hypothetical protein
MARSFLVAGVDFGTSFSKVVLREQGTGEAVVVPFPEHPGGLLQSLIGIENDELIPPAALEDCACIAYLKMLAAYSSDGSALDRGPVEVPRALYSIRQSFGDGKTVRGLLAFYFAHVVAATEAFINSAQSPWRHFDLNGDHLVFQLAVPTGLLDKDGDTERLFRKAFIAGYQLRKQVDSQLKRPIQFSVWSDQVEDVLSVGLPTLLKVNPWQCLDYPEVLAAMQTVFRSPNPQQDGLYLTMDVGAGTVELNAFLRNTGEHLPPEETVRPRNLDYYSMRVCALGIHNIKDPYGLVKPRNVKELAAELRDEIGVLYRRALVRQPNLGHFPGQRTWDRARLLIFGGGAHLAPYRETFGEALREAGIHRPQIFDLPAASDLSLPEGVEFGRFAVAYGMSFFRPNLDQWRPPEDILPFNTLYPPDDGPVPKYGMDWED